MPFNVVPFQEYDIAVVADLDHSSRHPENFEWYSVLWQGTLFRSADETYSVAWNSARDLVSRTAMGNRSMELSELVRYRHLLFSMCDITGIVFKIRIEDGKIFQRYAIADGELLLDSLFVPSFTECIVRLGDGEEPKPMKIEWATVKVCDVHVAIGKFVLHSVLQDGLLYIGSIGKELTDEVRGMMCFVHSNFTSDYDLLLP